ncbi:hypothetical protein ILUMI_17296, partial [Ignelater luminosus]
MNITKEKTKIVLYSKVKFKYNCYNCGKPGHKPSKCRFKTEGHWKKQHKPKRYQSANISEQEENKNQDYINFIASSKKSQVVNNEKRDTITWILDSGASEHMVNRLEYFYKLEDLEIPVQITIAKDGENYLIAKKCGYIKMYAENGRIIKVDKVLYVQNLKFNLMFVSKLEKRGLKVIFHKGRADILQQNTTITQAKREGKLYELTLVLEVTENGMVTTVSDHNLNIWRRRFGHLNKNSLLELFKNNVVDGLPNI